MICPNAEKCGKKACIEMERCTDPLYWESLSKHISERNTKRRNKVKTAPVVHSPGWKSKRQIRREQREKGCPSCNKRETCDLLAQCIMTLPLVVSNPVIADLIKGSLCTKQILAVLRDHHITPMKSYYYHTKYWNGKQKGKEAQ